MEYANNTLKLAHESSYGQRLKEIEGEVTHITNEVRSISAETASFKPNASYWLKARQAARANILTLKMKLIEKRAGKLEQEYNGILKQFE